MKSFKPFTCLCLFTSFTFSIPNNSCINFCCPYLLCSADFLIIFHEIFCFSTQKNSASISWAKTLVNNSLFFSLFFFVFLFYLHLLQPYVVRPCSTITTTFITTLSSCKPPPSPLTYQAMAIVDARSIRKCKQHFLYMHNRAPMAFTTSPHPLATSCITSTSTYLTQSHCHTIP